MLVRARSNVRREVWRRRQDGHRGKPSAAGRQRRICERMPQASQGGCVAAALAAHRDALAGRFSLGVSRELIGSQPMEKISAPALSRRALLVPFKTAVLEDGLLPLAKGERDEIATPETSCLSQVNR